MRQRRRSSHAIIVPTFVGMAFVGLSDVAGHARAGDPADATTSLPAAAAGRIDFTTQVEPILISACRSCHGDKKQRGGYRLDSREAALRGGHILPGKSAESPMILLVAGLNPDLKMPPAGKPLAPTQVGILRAWIDQGATWSGDQGKSVRVEKSIHWAYRPLTSPPVPAIPSPDVAGWPRTPVDAFILAALRSKGMTPSAPADERALLRRVYLDLTGLPPTPPEIDAFLNDREPGAYERVVDRLLASPRYGERWARHWMDVIHWAETHGHDQDVPREHAWPYRDYLIRSFNQDKPYGRFVAEQIAGDVLAPDDASGVIATGMITAGPWDESSQQSIRDDTVDKKIAQNLDRDDMVTTVMSAFSGTTVHCARCHNHKFDPVSQAEYYGLQACFAGIDRANRGYDPEPSVARSRRDLTRRRTDLETNRVETARLLAAGVQSEVAAWEQTVTAGQPRWTVLDPAATASANGSKPVTMADRSVCFVGARPETDTYTIETPVEPGPVTAVRLELLPDDQLPHRGPGRQDNGNLHLSEFRVLMSGRGAAKQPVVLSRAVADFNQADWGVERAIDGKPETAWGIYPEVGKPHWAVFEFAQPVNAGRDTRLTFVLDQRHGGGHLIGRLRLSATGSARPTAAVQPSAVAAILDIPPAARTAENRADLARHVLLEQVNARLKALPPQRLVYAAASDFSPVASFRPANGCRAINVLRRGDVTQPGDAARPGALSCVPGLPATFALPDPANEGARRVALAHWLSDGKNVLTWRVIVNRVWHYHFGRGIVATPGDLGTMGAPPTHPELLDWLAVWFRDHGGSLKQLHRLIVTSAVYRQSSRHRPEYAAVDADNLLLARMTRGRLDAEQFRDAVLLVSGKLDLTMGGPSVKHFIQGKGVHIAPTADYAGFDPDSPGAGRRSVYRFVFRTLPDPFLDALDCPDASQFAPARSSTVTPLQALALLNDRFMVRQCEHFAARVGGAGALSDQIAAAYRLALGRAPTPNELGRLTAYAAAHGTPNACRLLLNCNEFMFIP